MPLNKKILIITYYWPPCGGAGVQRWLKFSKYLPEYGWEPFVLTADPAYTEFPAIDNSLEDDIHPSVKVYKTKAVNYFRMGRRKKADKGNAGSQPTVNDIKNRLARFIRGNFFIPDPRKGWNKYAFNKAVEIIQKEGISIMASTGPPHSTHLIALKLKKKYPWLKWVSDFRDPWTDIYYYKYFYGTLPARIIDKKYEREVVLISDKILTIGEGMKSLISSKYRDAEEKITVITNGYDEADFHNLRTEKRKSNKIIITYVGSISDLYPADTLYKVLGDRLSLGKSDFILRFIGNVSDRNRKHIERKGLLDNVEIHPYTTHKEAIQYMLSADILLLVIPEHKNNGIIITGKLFEYIRARVPVLFLGPLSGDAAKILRELNYEYSYDPYDYEGLRYFMDSSAGTLRNPENNRSISRFERKQLSSKLAEVLTGIVQ